MTFSVSLILLPLCLCRLSLTNLILLASRLPSAILSPTHPTAFLSRSEGLDHAEGASKRVMVASGGVLSEGYGHGGPGICLGDGQREAYLKNMGMTGLTSVWAMARGRPI